MSVPPLPEMGNRIRDPEGSHHGHRTYEWQDYSQHPGHLVCHHALSLLLQGQPHSCFHSQGVCTHLTDVAFPGAPPSHTCPASRVWNSARPGRSQHFLPLHCARYTHGSTPTGPATGSSFFHSIKCRFLLWAEHLPNSGLQIHSPRRLPHLSKQNHPLTSLLSFKLMVSGMFGYLCIFHPNSCAQGRWIRNHSRSRDNFLDRGGGAVFSPLTEEGPRARPSQF